ncbi:hypothetical protein L7F22_058015 [Adiantum nelumboides]|nr:hypothetical protein [Adiantum nelumboides]
MKAHRVFDSLLTLDVVVWTALIGGYVEHGVGDVVICYLKQMFLNGISPSPITLIFSLNACNSSGAIDTSKQVHMDILKMGYESDLIAGNALVGMYARCGSFIEACLVFDTLQVQYVVTWNILISACINFGFEEAICCMEEMVLEGVLPNWITYSCTLKCCSRLGAIERGCTIHIQAVKEGTDKDYTIGNVLLNLYAKYGSLSNARKVLNAMPS